MVETNKSSDDAKEASNISSFFLSDDKKSNMMEEVEEEVCLSASGNIDIILNIEPRNDALSQCFAKSIKHSEVLSLPIPLQLKVMKMKSK